MSYYFRMRQRRRRKRLLNQFIYNLRYAAVVLTVGLFLLLVLRTTAAAATTIPVYTNQTSNITADAVPFATLMWDSTDPYGFSAINYALYYSDLFRTNGLQVTEIPSVMTNYVTKASYDAGTNVLMGLIYVNTVDIGVNTLGIATNVFDIAALGVRTTQAESDITNLSARVDYNTTNPPSFSGVITNMEDVVYLWQSGTNIVLDAEGYRYHYNASIVTGYVCTAQSGINDDLVGTTFYRPDAPAGGTVYNYIEQDATFVALLQFSTVSSLWVFSDDTSLTLSDLGTVDQASVTLASGATTATFVRDTNLTYVTLSYIENFATSTDLAVSVVELEAADAALETAYEVADTVNALSITNYVDSEVAVVAGDLASLSNIVDDIIYINISGIVEAFFATNKFNKLWGADTNSSRYVVLEGDDIVMYEVGPGTVWSMVATGTSVTNGTFTFLDTPVWPSRLGTDETSSDHTVYHTALGTNAPYWTLNVVYYNGESYRDIEVSANGEYLTGDRWATIASEYEFAPSATENEYSPASIVMGQDLGIDPGVVTVSWAVSAFVTNEIGRIEVISPAPANIGDVKAEDSGDGSYDLYRWSTL